MHSSDYDTRVAAYPAIVEVNQVLLTWFNGEGRVWPHSPTGPAQTSSTSRSRGSAR